MPNPDNDQRVIAQTKKWVETVIISHNYCPFAKREVDRGSVRYHVVHDTEFNNLLEEVFRECVYLDQNPATETTLIIFPEKLEDFGLYLDCLYLVEELLKQQGYEGKYQVASFHPDYTFQGSAEDDAANYTNRSPYPMFHLIREASVQRAVEHHPDPESIPERNVNFAREQGLDKMKALLKDCYEVDDIDE